MAVASLVTGILSLVIVLFGGRSLLVSIFFGAVAIILGALSRSDPEKKSMATAGMVCGIIGATLSILFYVACVALVTDAFHVFWRL